MHPLLLALVIVAGIWLAIVAVLFLAGRKGMAREVAAFLPNLLALFRGLLRDPRTPRSAKLLLIVAIGWIASPIDLIPEFIPVAGPLDVNEVGMRAEDVQRLAGHADLKTTQGYRAEDPEPGARAAAALDELLGQSQ